MQVAVRSSVTTGVALISAGVIAVSPVAPPMPEMPDIATAAVHSAPVALTASYAELFDNTLSSLGVLADDLFEEGIAPILQQVAVNQLTMVQDLGAAVHRLFEASNPAGIPATFGRAFEQLAAGQIQEAAETLSTGVILAALPLLPPLQAPINNLVAVIDLVPQVIPLVGIGLISPPLSLFQATAEAVQDVANAFGAGDFNGVVNAFINAPATVLNGVINGYADNGFPGLIGPGGGSLGVIVNIRDMILDAITPAEAGAATETAADETPETAAVTATTSSPALTVSLDVTPASGTTEASEDAAESETSSETAGTGGGDEGDTTAVSEAAEEEEVTDEDEVTESPVDEAAEVEDPVTEEESESESGGTDLSDGNKVTPGGTADDDAGAATGDSSEETDTSADTSTGNTGSDSGSGSGDSSDSGSGDSGSDSGGSSDSE